MYPGDGASAPQERWIGACPPRQKAAIDVIGVAMFNISKSSLLAGSSLYLFSTNDVTLVASFGGFANVTANQQVYEGEVIGTVLKSSCTPNIIHLTMTRIGENTYLNPQPFLERRDVNSTWKEENNAYFYYFLIGFVTTIVTLLSSFAIQRAAYIDKDDEIAVSCDGYLDEESGQYAFQLYDGQYCGADGCTDGDNDYIELVRWMSRNGFKGALLKPANFKETGRGLMATKPFQHTGVLSKLSLIYKMPIYFQIGDQVISIPEMLLITTQNVLSSYLGDFIKQQTRPKLSPMQVICTYLICERSRQKDSFWYNYIKVLPKSYSNPVYFTNEEINWLPRRIKRKVFDECEKINTAYRELKNLFSILESTFVSFKGIFEYSAFRWAWCTVNTRSVYMLQEQNPHLSIERDHYALAPFLDLLNHTNTVEVKASYNPVSKCYEIFTCTACKKYDQMFIYYGPHDNVKLFIEYGFVLPQNQHNVVELDFEDIYCKTCEERKLLRNKLDFFQSHNLTTKLTCSLDGLSWKLVTVLKILSMLNTDM
uniref:SET domain-containing protein 4-like n=1 Tax=Saccoglossus kowalevskii TaxID=10224 RepID=A0ABM0MJ43_SACKO|nr:PREDICTED: SET domain-containing protein 4-like [Saccoglossus kowalevskii]